MHKRIALTFDACQTARYKTGFDMAIVATLQRTHTPATFFLGGLWMQTHFAEAKALAANPLFEIGSHSWSHLDFTKISAPAMQSEIVQTQAELTLVTGHRTTLFRFPYGHYNNLALAQIAANGLTAIQWDVVSGDPDPRVSAQRMRRVVESRVTDGSIIIMHVNGRGWHTAQSLPGIISDLRAQGYTFVSVSELLKPAT